MGFSQDHYLAIIPPKYWNERVAPDFLMVRLSLFLSEHGVGKKVDGNINFRVTQDESGWYAIAGAPANPEIHGGRKRYRDAISVLEQLIHENKICLVYEGWSNALHEEYKRKKKFDPVELAEQIPTLILQEVLANRLKAK